MRDEIAWMPATEMAKAIREKRLSPVEVTEALLDRIDAVNPAINAYVLVTREIVQAGKLLDVQVLDHLVIGRGCFVSMRERGLGFL